MVTFYGSLDVFVLPSNNEAMGNALMEAMLSRVPAVASRVGGSMEIIEDRVSGLLFTPGDSDELTQAIKELLQNDTLRKKVSLAGRERVMRNFTIEQMASSTERCYYSLFDAGDN